MSKKEFSISLKYVYGDNETTRSYIKYICVVVSIIFILIFWDGIKDCILDTVESAHDYLEDTWVGALFNIIVLLVAIGSMGAIFVVAFIFLGIYWFFWALDFVFILPTFVGAILGIIVYHWILPLSIIVFQKFLVYTWPYKYSEGLGFNGLLTKGKGDNLMVRDNVEEEGIEKKIPIKKIVDIVDIKGIQKDIQRVGKEGRAFNKFVEGLILRHNIKVDVKNLKSHNDFMKELIRSIETNRELLRKVNKEDLVDVKLQLERMEVEKEIGLISLRTKSEETKLKKQIEDNSMTEEEKRTAMLNYKTKVRELERKEEEDARKRSEKEKMEKIREEAKIRKEIYNSYNEQMKAIEFLPEGDLKEKKSKEIEDWFENKITDF